ncbi:uncharacterized protein LOC118232229 isoform X3 [Anguilla anguilla]|uniref:uncharacterized protein LOC118232229 isoform X2 n=1 Tax=Anguilla anguilla TaxID=7936 RepID=UPI0015B04893|nr:uncharacterized protein LOC118232229 isoform X2 [Anguilla anguilla]XP_035282907.1 uncharacterized protein LOC118232229 isoform X3 [Anguilla anguilla]
MAANLAWSEEMERQLISFFSEHPCLWKVKLEVYKDKDRRDRCMEALCNQLNSAQTEVVVTVDIIKKKFKNMRTTFQWENKAASSKRSGDGADDVYIPRWKYYKDLLFLKEGGEPNETEDNIPSQSQPIQIETATPPIQIETATPDKTTSKNVKKQKTGDISKAEVAMEYALECLKRQEQKSESAHAGFLKYLDECLQEVPVEKLRSVKRKIIEIVHTNIEE